MGFSTIKLIGGALFGLGMMGLVWLAQDRFHQKGLADDARACSTAATKGTDLDRCLPGTKIKLKKERRAAKCDQALLPQLRDETRFEAGIACPAGVKRLIADYDAAAFERDNAIEEAGDARAAIGPAIERAERRANNSAQRKETARDVINTAPRDPAGRITCDAECLRRLGDK